MLLSIENGFGIIAGRIEHAWKTVRIQLMIDRQHRHDVTGKEKRGREKNTINYMDILLQKKEKSDKNKI